MQPLVGITSGRRMVPSTKGETRATVLYTTYTSMVSRAGGLPVILTPGSAEEARAMVGRLDGLLLSGGGDVDPSRYDGSPVETLYGVDPLRDEYEIALARAARDIGLPTLAICRGMQVLNVALGGSLVEDIPSEDPSALPHRVEGLGTVQPQHTVSLDPDSAVAAALGTAEPMVNTIHHQALRDLGEGLRTVGTAPDGVIEAIESTDDWHLWCVQWHPEYLGPDDEPSIALFRTLIEVAGR